MMRSRNLSSVLLCVTLLLSGCGIGTVPATDTTKPAITNRDDIWSNLADTIKGGLVANSTQLQLIVGHLRTLQKINDSDVAACYGLFDGIDKKELPMGADEAAKLLTLPVKMIREAPTRSSVQIQKVDRGPTRIQLIQEKLNDE